MEAKIMAPWKSAVFLCKIQKFKKIPKEKTSGLVLSFSFFSNQPFLEKMFRMTKIFGKVETTKQSCLKLSRES